MIVTENKRKKLKKGMMLSMRFQIVMTDMFLNRLGIGIIHQICVVESVAHSVNKKARKIPSYMKSFTLNVREKIVN